jgi:hypothetical protein
LSDHPASLAPERLLKECDQRFLRRSGPGGQNRNKVETAVVLTHRPTGLVAEVNERRSQAENRKEAMFRLRLDLAIGVRLEAGPDDAPSALWASRCRGGRIVVSPSHDDFPAILAEALDVIASRGWDVKVAANVLGCTASQLVKLLKDEPRALAKVNQERKAAGLGVLK